MSDNLSWRRVFLDRLLSCGLNEQNAQKIYLAEMEARTFFDFNGIMPGCLMLQNIEQNDKEIGYFGQSYSKEAPCPFCDATSTAHLGDFYTKPVQDIPQNNKAVYHVVRSGKYLCKNSACERKRFTERFVDFCEEDARKSFMGQSGCC